MKARAREPVLLVYTTTSTRTEAEGISQILLEERLTACANIFPILSRYRWKGKIEKSRECGMILKTRRGLYRKVEARIRALHGYTVPAIVAWELSAGSKPFLEWVRQETQQPT